MVKSCVAVGCSNRAFKGSKLSFYRFPADPERRQKWIAALRRKNWKPNRHSWVCSSHFISGEKSDDCLSPDYVPSIFCHVPISSRKRKAKELDDYGRRKRMKELRTTATHSSHETRIEQQDSLLSQETTESLHCDEGDHDIGEPLIETVAVSSAEVQTELTSEFLCHLQKQSQQLQNEKCKLEKLLESVQLNEESLKSDDDKVKFYTGLPCYSVMNTVFLHVSTDFKCNESSLPKFQQFLMTLMKLRLNLSNQDLAYRFGISQSTVSKYFRKWINVMYIRLQPVIRWPSREELYATMPTDFKNKFSRCVCIIDCFEVFCERSSDLLARAQTYSNYKHHNTIKFLIGISPQGVISYVSKGWGGRVSDKHLTEQCGVLDNLLPGDQVLADRGFSVADTVGLYCAEIKTPSFTKGKKQLSRMEVDLSRQLSRVRIHVERVIGVLRQKYTILQSTIPINMIMCEEITETSLIDEIVVVCSAMCNFCESVVLF